MRVTTLAIAGLLLLTGCGGEDENEPIAAAAPTTDEATEPTNEAPATTAGALSAGDMRTCSEFIAGLGDTYAALVNYQDTGTSTGAQLVGIYNIGGLAQPWTTIAENSDLVVGLETLVEFQEQTRAEIGAGNFDPTRHIRVLEYAAELCDSGGVLIAWN